MKTPVDIHLDSFIYMLDLKTNKHLILSVFASSRSDCLDVIALHVRVNRNCRI